MTQDIAAITIIIIGQTMEIDLDLRSSKKIARQHPINRRKINNRGSRFTLVLCDFPEIEVLIYLPDVITPISIKVHY